MVDVLKITSPIAIKNKVQNIPSKLPTDAVFDIANPNQIIKEKVSGTKETGEEGGKESLLRNLNKEIFEPLLHSTRAQADGLRKLVLMAKLLETSNGLLPENFLDGIFVKPHEMLNELLAREKAATIFSGEFFDSLRMLVRMEGQPKLTAAIVSILKYYEGYVNQENSLFAIVKQGKNLANALPKEEGKLLQQQMETLDTMVKLSRLTKQNSINEQRASEGLDPERIIKLDLEKQSVMRDYLKNEIIPGLGRIAKRYQGSDKIYNQIMSMVHNLVRYDKADPRLLEDAIFQFGDELKRLTELSGKDIIEMKKFVFENAVREQEEVWNSLDKKNPGKAGNGDGDTDMASLLSRALDKSGPAKITSAAHQLLLNLIQSESPMTPLIHFVIPFRYMDENVYGEFFVDKECKGRRGDGKAASNIFFTIQSDKYGNFEVDLLAADKKIDLDIRCPDALVSVVKEIRFKWKEIMEEQGFRLANYHVAAYEESQTILQRFPKLTVKKVGIDVRV